MRSGDLDAEAEVSVKRLILPVTPAAAGPGGYRRRPWRLPSPAPSFGCAQEERLTQLSPPLLATQPQEVPRHRLARFQRRRPRSSHTRSGRFPRPSRQGGPYSTGHSLSPQQSSVFLSHRRLCRARRDGRFFFRPTGP